MAARSEIVFTMVGEPADVAQVILGTGGILERIQPGSVMVDMTTSEPSLALANQFYTAAMAEGLETEGTHALYKVLDRMNRP